MAFGECISGSIVPPKGATKMVPGGAGTMSAASEEQTKMKSNLPKQHCEFFDDFKRQLRTANYHSI